MFRILLWKEIRENIMTFRFGSAFITLFVLSLMSTWILGDDYLRRRDTYNKISDEASMELRNCKVPSFLEPVLHYPPSPLGIFAKGEEKRLGNAVRIQRWEVPRDASDSLTDNMLLSAQAPFDFLAIFTIVVSAFGILFSYDSISGERERGSLKQLCSQGPGRSVIYTAKFVAGSIALAIPVIISLLSSLLVLQIMQGLHFSLIQCTAILQMMITGIVYGAVFIAIGLLCSSLVRRTSVALILALFIWTISIILLPRLSPGLASSFYTIPSPSEVNSYKNTSWDEVKSEVLSRFREIAPRYPNISFWGTYGSAYPRPIITHGSPNGFLYITNGIRILEPLWQERADAVWNLERQQETELEKQAEIARWFSVISPAHQIRVVFTALAGTNYSQYKTFMENARRYRREMLDGLRDRGYFGAQATKFFTQIPLEVGLEGKEAINNWYSGKIAMRNDSTTIKEFEREKYWDDLPADIVPPINTRSVQPEFEATLWPAATLLIMMLMIFFIGLVAFHRYDIR